MSTCLQQGRKSQREGWCGLKPGPGPPWRRHSHCPTDAGARSWSLDDRTMNFASRFCIVTLLGCVTSVGRSVYWHYCSASHPWVVLYIDIIAVRHIRGSFCILTLLQCVTSVGRSVYWDYYSASHPWVVPVRWCWGVRLVKNCWGSILLGSVFLKFFISSVYEHCLLWLLWGRVCVGGGGGVGGGGTLVAGLAGAWPGVHACVMCMQSGERRGVGTTVAFMIHHAVQSWCWIWFVSVVVITD